MDSLFTNRRPPNRRKPTRQPSQQTQLPPAKRSASAQRYQNPPLKTQSSVNEQNRIQHDLNSASTLRRSTSVDRQSLLQDKTFTLQNQNVTAKNPNPPLKKQTSLLSAQRPPPKKVAKASEDNSKVFKITNDIFEAIKTSLDDVIESPNNKTDIPESYAKLIEHLMNKFKAENSTNTHEKKKEIEKMLKQYRQKLKVIESTRLEESTPRNSYDENHLPKAESEKNANKIFKILPKLSRSKSHESFRKGDKNGHTEIGDFKNRLSKVIGDIRDSINAKSTDALNETKPFDESKEKDGTDATHSNEKRELFPENNTSNKDNGFQSYLLDDLLNPPESFQDILLNDSFDDFVSYPIQSCSNSSNTVSRLEPTENFAKRRDETKLQEERQYYKTLEEKLQHLLVSSNETRNTEGATDSPTLKHKRRKIKQPDEIKKITEVKNLLTKLISNSKKPKFDQKKAAKTFTEAISKYEKIAAISNVEFEILKYDVDKLFDQTKNIFDGDLPTEPIEPPLEFGSAGRDSVSTTTSESTAQASQITFEGREVASAAEIDDAKANLAQLKRNLEEIVKNIETTDFLNNDLYLQNLGNYQDQLSGISTHLTPDIVDTRKQVFNLLIQAYHLLDVKSTKN